MKTLILIPALVSFLFSACKKGPIPEAPLSDPGSHTLVKATDDKKKNNRSRLQFRPFCYKDFNMAYLDSKKEGC